MRHLSLVPSPLQPLVEAERRIADQRKDELKTARRRLRNLSHRAVASPLGWSRSMAIIGSAAAEFWNKQHDKE